MWLFQPSWWLIDDSSDDDDDDDDDSRDDKEKPFDASVMGELEGDGALHSGRQ